MRPVVRALWCFAAALPAACAPDSWRPDPEFNAWTASVIRECRPHTIGKEPLDSRFRQESFLNVTSRLYSGRITARQWTNSVNSFYPGDNRAAIDCILERVPAPKASTAR
jgi:hypothetical protein